MSCSVEDCDRTTHARALCMKHYQRLRLTGDPLKARGYGGTDEERRQRRTARKRRHYENNREDVLAKAKQRYDADPETHQARARQWLLDNPQRARELAQRRSGTRRARLHDAFVEHVEPAVLYAAYNGICGICGDPTGVEEFEVDHVIPLARGGEHSYANTQPAHPGCNRRKWAHVT